MDFELISSKDAQGNLLDSPETLFYTATIENNIFTVVRNIENKDSVVITNVNVHDDWSDISDAIDWFKETTLKYR